MEFVEDASGYLKTTSGKYVKVADCGKVVTVSEPELKVTFHTVHPSMFPGGGPSANVEDLLDWHLNWKAGVFDEGMTVAGSSMRNVWEDATSDSPKPPPIYFERHATASVPHHPHQSHQLSGITNLRTQEGNGSLSSRLSQALSSPRLSPRALASRFAFPSSSRDPYKLVLKSPRSQTPRDVVYLKFDLQGKALSKVVGKTKQDRSPRDENPRGTYYHNSPSPADEDSGQFAANANGGKSQPEPAGR